MIPTKDTITVTTATGGLDAWGNPIAPTTKTLNCRIDYRTEKVVNANGEELVSKANILIKGKAVITPNDTISWTDYLGTHEAKPISVQPLNDLSKTLFTKVVV